MKKNLSRAIPPTLVVLAGLLIGSTSTFGHITAPSLDHKAQRAGLEIDITASRGQIQHAFTHIESRLITCSQRNASAASGWDHIQISAEGRFFDFHGTRHEGDFSVFGLKGERREGRIYGKTMYRARSSTNRNPENKYYCWSGQSWKDPWVRYVAKPVA